MIGRYTYIGGQKLDTNIKFELDNLNLESFVTILWRWWSLRMNNMNWWGCLTITGLYMVGIILLTARTSGIKNGRLTFVVIFRYEFNDHQVSKISKDSVESEAAYILFYKKKSPWPFIFQFIPFEFFKLKSCSIVQLKFLMSRNKLKSLYNIIRLLT